MDSQTPDTSSPWTTQVLSYLSLALGLLLLIKYLRRSNVPSNIPPFPAKAYPIVGHLPYFKKGTREQLKEWREKTGEIFSLYFGPNLTVVLNSYEASYEAFVKHADVMSDRPLSLVAAAGKKYANLGIVTASGHTWKEQRTVSLQILRSFGMGKNILALKVSEEVLAYTETIRQLSGQPSDVRTLTNTAVSNVICSIIVGKRFEYDDAYFVEFLHLMNEQMKLTSASSVFGIFPWLRFLPGDLFGAKKRMKISHHILDFFCDHYIDKLQNEYDENNLDDFISAYLWEKIKMEEHGKETTLNKANLRRTLLHLFIAGTETTSTTILWFLLYMLHHPDIQAKIYEELTAAVGTERAVTMQDRTSLNYFNAAILETQRLSSIVPLGVPHYAREDAIVKGYTIPAGTTVLLNIDAVLWDSDTWKDPMEFRPERFLDAQGKLSQPEQFLPFSIGRRVCLGEALAKMELFLFLSAIVQRFELHPAEPGRLPSRESVHGLTSPPQPFQIRFVER